MALNQYRFVSLARQLVKLQGELDKAELPSSPLGEILVEAFRATKWEAPKPRDRWNVKSLNVSKNEEDIMWHEGKIHAIKAYRDRTGASLIDAKTAVENHALRYNITFKS